LRNSRPRHSRLITYTTLFRSKEKQIRKSLREKETLLTEVHHRVKNNLAVVSGLMQLQAYDQDSSKIKDKLFDSVARIQTMAAIQDRKSTRLNSSHVSISYAVF